MSRPVNIVHIIGTIEPAGAEMLLLHLLAAMQGGDYRFCVFYLRGRGTLRPKLDEMNIESVCLGVESEKQFWKLPAVARHIRRCKADIVHIHTHLSKYWLTLAAKLAGARAVFQTTHGFYHHQPHRLKWVRLLERFNSLAATRQFAVSQAVKHFIITQFKVPEHRIRVLYNGIPAEEATPDAAQGRRIGLTGGRLNVVCVANLTPRIKGYEILLPAFQKFVQAQPAARLFLIGEGPLRGWIEQFVARHGLQQHVTLLGRRLDVRRLLPLFDLFVLPSLSEGLSLSLLEALFAGLPVIATRTGGIPEVLEDGANGTLVAAGDAGALCAALIAFAQNPAPARNTAKHARERARSRFSLEQMTAALDQAYRKALAEEKD